MSKKMIGKSNHVRLRNVTGIDCFINTSVNCFLGVSTFIREGLDASKCFDNFMCEMKQSLGSTQYQCELDILGNLCDVKGFLSSKLDELVSGDESNREILRVLLGKILMIEELLFLKGLGSEVGNPGILRGILKDYFGYFGEMRQQDA